MSEKLPRNLSPLRRRAEIAVVLGTGLSALERMVSRIESVPYAEIPGFAVPTVAGHPGRLSLCRINGSLFLIFAGRFHLYEGSELSETGRTAALAKSLGCRRMLVTHTAGSLQPDLTAGSWLLPDDIVSLPWKSCLPHAAAGRGGKDASAGFRVACRHLISRDFRCTVRSAAHEAGVDLHEGLLFFANGPAYETPAEARAAAVLGADAATMSSLPELFTAHAAGLETAVLSWITNQSANVSGGGIDHSEVVRRGASGARILLKIIEKLSFGNYKCY